MVGIESSEIRDLKVVSNEIIKSSTFDNEFAWILSQKNTFTEGGSTTTHTKHISGTSDWID